MKTNLFIGLAVLTTCSFASSTASAQVTVAGTGEPQFTRSDNNTQWVEWSASPTWDTYALRLTYRRDGVQVAQESFSANRQGEASFNWTGVVPLPLEQGRAYEICVQGHGTIGGVPANDGPDTCTSGPEAGKRTSTIIDRSKPEISVELAAGAAKAPAGSVPLSISYSDTQSPAFPANFLCFGSGPDKDTPCGEGDIYGFSQPCSNTAPVGLATTFECAVDTTAVNPDDGLLWACVTSADSSFPDNATSDNQTRPANTANLSEKVCDSVDLISAACTAAEGKLAKAKAKVRRLKQNDASKQKVRRAKARVKDAKAAVKSACL
jgi:hypothetical protein